MLLWVITILALLIAAGLVLLLVQAQRRLRRLERRSTEREQSLRAELDQVQWQRDGVLKAVEDALLLLDQDQQIVISNHSADVLFGPALPGKSLIQAVQNPKLEALVQAAQLVRGEGMERRIEYEQRILHARAVVLQNDGDLFEVLSLRDVTEMQRLERARREMVSNISHELSTPITAIGLLADTLLDTAAKEKPKRMRKMAADIKREVDTLTQLVQEMRDLSLIESGQMPVRLTPTELLGIVEASVAPLESLMESKKQTISIAVPDDVTILADSNQLQRAIKNIVHNAVKFSPERGVIHITATPIADEAILAIKDSGPGISPEDLPRIFERFFQADRARRLGTGLGLAIVRHIVLAHGGRVWAESLEGHGATFFMALALAEPAAVAAAVKKGLVDGG